VRIKKKEKKINYRKKKSRINTNVTLRDKRERGKVA